MIKPSITSDKVKDILENSIHPRVTEESIQDKIDMVRYVVDETTTICIIVMKNGFRFVGTSTPASSKNFNPDVGRFYAYENAFRKIWPYEGYLLREQLHTKGE